MRLGAEKFRKSFIENCELDPYLEGLTLPAVSHKVYRMKYMKPDSLVVCSAHGLDANTKFSNQACIWLQWLEHKYAIQIQGAHNGVEKQVGRYRLDGYRFATSPNCERTDIVGPIAYEFLGCM